MTFRTHCQISKGLVDPAPLVNVVFLLLLFFVLNSQLVTPPGLPVNLPPTDAPVVITVQPLIVTAARDDLLFFDNQPVAIEKLEHTLRDAVQQGRARELIIRADSHVSHGVVTEIMSAALRAGIPTVNIAARPEVPAAGVSQ